MPTYHYRCDACSHAFDAFQKFSEDPLRVCPQCEGAIRRVIQPTPVVFKGSGWYITDSKAKPAAKDGGTAKKDDGGDKTEAKAETKSEAKPDAKPEAKPEPVTAKKETVAAPAD